MGDRFRANPIPWIAITLIGFVAYLAVTLVVRAVGVNSVVLILLMFLVVAVVVWLLQAAMVRGALYEPTAPHRISRRSSGSSTQATYYSSPWASSAPAW